MTQIDIVTNVSLNDGIRIFYSLPNWVRVFNSRINEITIVVDEKAVEGRIGKLHNKSYPEFELNKVLEELVQKYPFVNVQKLDYSRLKEVSSKFFRTATPIRCQGGTPIFAFLAAITFAKDGIILKTDCDILYSDCGWVNESIKLLMNNDFDIVEPPKLGSIDFGFSTRCFLLNKKKFMVKMPIKAYKLDFLRCILRGIRSRSQYLALEDMIQLEINKKKLNRKLLENTKGFSIHVNSHNDFADKNIHQVIYKIEKNIIPSSQKNDCNFSWEYWQES